MKVAVLLTIVFGTASAQVVITDSGSTNRPGLSVTLGRKGHAVIEDRPGFKAELTMQPALQTRFLKHVQSAGPLDKINARHCFKSVSFGSSMYISYNGARSPDISCSAQTDPVVIALQKDAQDIMAAARAKVPAGMRARMIR